MLNIQKKGMDKKVLINTLKGEIKDNRVLNAIKSVPREVFVSDELEEYAYLNIPLDIGFNQTISQPYVVALMCELLELKDGDRVLDIGTGSGYQAAVLSKLCKEVVSIEIIRELVKRAKSVIKDLGYTNIKVINGDGRLGCKRYSPYDKIICAAVSEGVPKIWKEQLSSNGIIVLPMYTDRGQELIRIREMDGKYIKESFGSVSFVPLV